MQYYASTEPIQFGYQHIQAIIDHEPTSLKPSHGTSQPIPTLSSIRLVRRRLHGLDVPNHLRIFVDTPIATEEPHARNTRDTLGYPLILVLIRHIDQIVRLAVAVEVVRDQVVVAVVDNAIDEGGKLVRVAKATGLDSVEDLAEAFVQFVFAVEVLVAEVFNVFGEVTEEEDVRVADLTSDFDLEIIGQWRQTRDKRALQRQKMSVAHICSVTSPDDQSSVEYKFHV